MSPVRIMEDSGKRPSLSPPRGNGSKNSLKVYFAGSIRGGRDCVFTYQSIVRLLEDLGHSVLTKHVADPSLTVATDTSNPTEVYDRDMSWMRSADVVVAEVTVPSLGVGYELGMATCQQKPTLCLYRGKSDLRKLSNLIRGHTGQAFCVSTYESENELREVVSNFIKSHNSGSVSHPKLTVDLPASGK